MIGRHSMPERTLGAFFCLNHEAILNFNRNEPTLKCSITLFKKHFTLISLTVFPVAQII